MRDTRDLRDTIDQVGTVPLVPSVSLVPDSSLPLLHLIAELDAHLLVAVQLLQPIVKPVTQARNKLVVNHAILDLDIQREFDISALRFFLQLLSELIGNARQSLGFLLPLIIIGDRERGLVYGDITIALHDDLIVFHVD